MCHWHEGGILFELSMKGNRLVAFKKLNKHHVISGLFQDDLFFLFPLEQEKNNHCQEDPWKEKHQEV